MVIVRVERQDGCNMGSIILVPPSSKISYVSNMTSSYETIRHHVMYDGGFTPAGPSAFVTIQKPMTQEHYYDPMMSYHAFYRMGSKPRISKRAVTSSPMIHSISVGDINRTFWGYDEIIEIVSEFYGNLLIQIEDTRWNFSATDTRDSRTVMDFVGRRKNNHIRVKREFRSEVGKWLSDNCLGDYDLIENNSSYGLHEDDVYVRDDIEAIHFKMRWFGTEPEPSDE